jgi:hypothetical protein
MTATITEQIVHALEIVKEEEIAAPIAVVFETILEQMGPENEAPGTGPMPMKLEAWPGGRWYRDLGNNSGHFWGNVQAIKPPTLLWTFVYVVSRHLECAVSADRREWDYTAEVYAQSDGADSSRRSNRTRLGQPDNKDSIRGPEVQPITMTIKRRRS